MTLTARVQCFVDAVCEGVANVDAYRQNFDCSRMRPGTVHRRAHDLRHNPDVDEAIKKQMEQMRAASIRTAADVTNEFLRIAYADPGKIVQHRRLCCRYCYGIDHGYQWKDEAEFVHAHTLAVQENEKRDAKGERPLPEPDDLGGYGFLFNLPPHAKCPKCLGEGKPDVFIVDTTKLSPEDRRLIERIKVTKDGIEIRFRNQQDALKQAGQMLGGYKQTVVLQNPDGSPINAAPAVIAMSPDQAATAYKEWMDGGKKPDV